MDLAVNSLTILVAVFATGRIAKHFGMPFTLASIPVLIGVGADAAGGGADWWAW